MGRVFECVVSTLSGPTGHAPEPILGTIGDISYTSTSVYLPTGAKPVRGSVWTVSDMSRTEEKISTAGIVLAIIFVWFCLIGLLFLLMKDKRTVGFIQVTVQGDGFHHATMLPAHDSQSGMHVQHMVNHARSVAAM